MRRALRILSIALITAGLVVLADVATTLAWKEPVSTIYGSIQQGKAEDQLNQLESEFPARADLRKVAHVKNIGKKVEILAGLFAKRVNTGEAIGRIQIPSINLDVVAVQGTDTASLQKGPGHYPETPFPGEAGTSAFAGHRTTYLAPFRHLDQLKQGDEIDIEMPYANFAYRVQKTRIVDASDVRIIHKVPLRAAGADRLPPAVQRRPADRRLREAEDGQLLRPREPGVERSDSRRPDGR